MRRLHVFRTVREAQRWRETVDDVGFVPTMGALHAGHQALLDRAKACDVVASSIFVNPTQFGPNEDLSTYPRSFERDLDMLRSSGVAAVFAPHELYSEDPFSVQPPAWLEGRAESRVRPGHFAGVATVCLKLFNVMRPSVVYIGQKDALQCVVLRKMVHDFNLNLRVEVVPTARDHDGLALSSRNAYLSAEERRAAPVVYRALRAAEGGGRTEEIIVRVTDVLRSEPLVTHIEYIDVADYDTMAPVDFINGPALVSVAVRVGTVRLIDNLRIL